MKNASRILAAGIAALVYFGQAATADAAQIKVLAGVGFRTVIDDLGPKFERATKHKLELNYDNSGAVVKQIQGGATADLVILPRDGIDALMKEGKIVGGSVLPLAHVTINLAVPKSAAKPNIASPDALKRMLLTAKSITFPDSTAGSATGVQFMKALDRLGIAKEVQAKSISADIKKMQGLVDSRKVDVVIHQAGNLLTLTGVDIIGPIPESLYQPIVFTAAVMNSAKDASAAKAFINFLHNPEAAKVITAKGMEPAK